MSTTPSRTPAGRTAAETAACAASARCSGWSARDAVSGLSINYALRTWLIEGTTDHSRGKDHRRHGEHSR